MKSKKGMSLATLESLLDEREEVLWRRPVPSKDMDFMVGYRDGVSIMIRGEDYEITDHALGQLLTGVGFSLAQCKWIERGDNNVLKSAMSLWISTLLKAPNRQVILITEGFRIIGVFYHLPELISYTATLQDMRMNCPMAEFEAELTDTSLILKIYSPLDGTGIVLTLSDVGGPSFTEYLVPVTLEGDDCYVAGKRYIEHPDHIGNYLNSVWRGRRGQINKWFKKPTVRVPHNCDFEKFLKQDAGLFHNAAKRIVVEANDSIVGAICAVARRQKLGGMLMELELQRLAGRIVEHGPSIWSKYLTPVAVPPTPKILQEKKSKNNGKETRSKQGQKPVETREETATSNSTGQNA